MTIRVEYCWNPGLGNFSPKCLCYISHESVLLEVSIPALPCLHLCSPNTRGHVSFSFDMMKSNIFFQLSFDNTSFIWLALRQGSYDKVEWYHCPPSTLCNLNCPIVLHMVKPHEHKKHQKQLNRETGREKLSTWAKQVTKFWLRSHQQDDWCDLTPSLHFFAWRYMSTKASSPFTLRHCSPNMKSSDHSLLARNFILLWSLQTVLKKRRILKSLGASGFLSATDLLCTKNCFPRTCYELTAPDNNQSL